MASQVPVVGNPTSHQGCKSLQKLTLHRFGFQRFEGQALGYFNSVQQEALRGE